MWPNKSPHRTSLSLAACKTAWNIRLSLKALLGTKALNIFSAVVDALNPIRNRMSGAHPNEVLLDEPEAMLVINAIRTLLHYLNARIGK